MPLAAKTLAMTYTSIGRGLFFLPTCALAALTALTFIAQPASAQVAEGQAPTAGFIAVSDFGAKPDGVTKCTDAIKQAIAAASAKGGGTVYFAPGTYLTGPIHLLSNITLYVDAGATLKFSTDFRASFLQL